jgi:hypothetical protein
MKADSIRQVSEERGNSYAIWLIRSAIAVNFIRFALSFSSRFEGTAGTVGLADRLFKLRWGGFRLDFVWLVVSTLVIFLAMFYFLLNLKSNPEAKIDTFFCVAWVVAFVIFIARAFLTGIIDFG